jgi:methyl-accepting chemotaxis protein
MFSELKIRTKLLVGFGILTSFSVVVALSAVFTISSLSTNVGNLLGVRIPQFQRTSLLIENIRSANQSMNDSYFIDELEGIKAELDTTNGNKKSAVEAMEKIKANLVTDKEKALFQNIQDQRALYLVVRTKTMDHLKAGNKTEALLDFKALKPLRHGFLTALKDLDSYEQEQAKLDGIRTEQSAKTARTAIIALVAAALAATLLVALWIIRGISRPLSAAIKTAQRIAERDLTVQVEGAGSTETGQLMAALREMVDNLKGIISETSSTSAYIASASTKLTSTTVRLATGIEEVASQAGTAATASAEMTATSSDIATNCHRAADSAQQAAHTTKEGFNVVKRTVDGIRQRGEEARINAKNIASLGERSDQIGAIVATIEDIADQTNLLALNAAIEAARAGEQGRGFAVVADEVRALAERTTRATKEIGGMIKAIQSETKSAISSMESGVKGSEQGATEAGQLETALQAILEQVDAVSMQVSQIATAAEQQTATTSEITHTIHDISQVVSETSRDTQESASAASDLSRRAEELQALVHQFKL